MAGCLTACGALVGFSSFAEPPPSGDASPSVDGSSVGDGGALGDVALDGSFDSGSTVDGAGPVDGCEAPGIVGCFGFEQTLVNGAKNSPLILTATQLFVAGKHGDALSLTVNNVAAFSMANVIGANDITIEAWVKPAAAGSMVLFDNQLYQLSFVQGGANDTNLFRCAGPGVEPAMSLESVTVGVWTHVACTFSSTSVTAFVGGKPSVPIVPAGVTGTSPTTARLGSSSGGANRYVGAVDDLRIFNVVRTSDEILATASK